MQQPKKPPELDHHTAKLIVGLIAFALPILVWWFSGSPIESISEGYWRGGYAQIILTGSLFAVAAFLAAYNGHEEREGHASKAASLAALGVALFPCDCNGHTEVIPHLHGISASVMFLILAYFCNCFYRRALTKKGRPHSKWRTRSRIYALCGTAMIVSMIVLGIDFISGGAIKARYTSLTFYGEWVGLWAFGFSWLTASRTLPLVTTEKERVTPFTEPPPDEDEVQQAA